MYDCWDEIADLIKLGLVSRGLLIRGAPQAFWGARFGVKNYGFSNIDRLTYVIEFGAGAF